MKSKRGVAENAEGGRAEMKGAASVGTRKRFPFSQYPDTNQTLRRISRDDIQFGIPIYPAIPIAGIIDFLRVRRSPNMIKFFKSFFSYVPSEPWPENPEDEPADPNLDLTLPEPVRAARRNLVAVSGIAIAWATAQFVTTSSKIEIAGVSVEFNISSIPVLLAVAILYLMFRWGMEFAMMSRTLRRWPLAQMDFKIVSRISRFALLAVAAGAIDRSIWIIVKITGSLGLLALASLILSFALMFVTMPLRMWVRHRAKVYSAANTVFEAVYWAGLFAVFLSIASFIAFGIASYTLAPLREAIWKSPPNPVALSIFVLTLTIVFLSHWLLRPITCKLFVERPGYTTTRGPDGRLVYSWKAPEKKPLL